MIYQSQASATPSSGTSITVAKPSGTVDGDVLVALVAAIISSSPYSFTPPAGWVATGAIAQFAASGGRMQIWTRVAGGSEPANYSWTVSNAITQSAAVVLRYAPQSPTTPPGVVDDAVMSSFQASGVVSPSVVATGNADTLIALFGAGSGTVGVPPSDMTQRAVIEQSNIKVAIYDEPLTATGATGTRTLNGPTSGAAGSILLFAEQAGSRIRMMI